MLHRKKRKTNKEPPSALFLKHLINFDFNPTEHFRIVCTLTWNPRDIMGATACIFYCLPLVLLMLMKTKSRLLPSAFSNLIKFRFQPHRTFSTVSALNRNLRDILRTAIYHISVCIAFGVTYANEDHVTKVNTILLWFLIMLCIHPCKI